MTFLNTPNKDSSSYRVAAHLFLAKRAPGKVVGLFTYSLAILTFLDVDQWWITDWQQSALRHAHNPHAN